MKFLHTICYGLGKYHEIKITWYNTRPLQIKTGPCNTVVGRKRDSKIGSNHLVNYVHAVISGSFNRNMIATLFSIKICWDYMSFFTRGGNSPLLIKIIYIIV